MQEILTPKEVSDILKIGINKTYSIMNSSAFPSYKIGNKMYVTNEALEEWLRKIQGKTIHM